MTSEVKQQQIEWRRTRVLELSSEGYSRSEICQKLHLDRVTVHRDIQFLRQQVNIIKDNPVSKVVLWGCSDSPHFIKWFLDHV
jgi:DNA-binding transcriptional regulator LsrR (DeoR family)